MRALRSLFACVLLAFASVAWADFSGSVFSGSVVGVNVNAAMVEQGMAWAYRQYVTDRSPIQLEAQAHAARRGLWVDPTPVKPRNPARASLRRSDGNLTFR